MSPTDPWGWGQWGTFAGTRSGPPTGDVAPSTAREGCAQFPAPGQGGRLASTQAPPHTVPSPGGVPLGQTPPGAREHGAH